MIEQTSKRQGEGITELLIAIVVVVGLLDVFLAAIAYILVGINGGEDVTGAFLVVASVLALLSSCVAALTAYRAKWTWSSVLVRAGACGGSGLVIGLLCATLLHALT